MARKYLSSQGYTQAEIDDFFLQKSCLSKTSLRKLRNESIYNEDNSVREVVECVPFYTEKCTTDLIIEELKSTYFPRIRRGIENRRGIPIPGLDYVLYEFSPDELTQLEILFALIIKKHFVI